MSKLAEMLAKGKAMVYEEELPVDTQSAAPAAAVPTVAQAVGDLAVAGDADAYSYLLQNSDPEQFNGPYKQCVSLYLRPLQTVIPDQAIAMKAAIAQAQAAGIKLQDIIADLDKAIRACDAEYEGFQQALELARKEQVEAKEHELDLLSQELSAKQQRIASLRVEVDAAGRKLASKQAAFSHARERRRSELLQLKANFAGGK